MDYIFLARLILGFGQIIAGIYFLYYSKYNPEKFKNLLIPGLLLIILGVLYLILYVFF